MIKADNKYLLFAFFNFKIILYSMKIYIDIHTTI